MNLKIRHKWGPECVRRTLSPQVTFSYGIPTEVKESDTTCDLSSGSSYLEGNDNWNVT